MIRVATLKLHNIKIEILHTLRDARQTEKNIFLHRF